MQKCEPHKRSPDAPKCEDKTQEETLQQEQCARKDAWEMTKNFHNLKDTGKTT